MPVLTLPGKTTSVNTEETISLFLHSHQSLMSGFVSNRLPRRDEKKKRSSDECSTSNSVFSIRSKVLRENEGPKVNSIFSVSFFTYILMNARAWELLRLTYHSPRASKQRILPRMSSGSSLFMSIFLSYATRASSHSCSFSYQVAWIS